MNEKLRLVTAIERIANHLEFRERDGKGPYSIAELLYCITDDIGGNTITLATISKALQGIQDQLVRIAKAIEHQKP